MLFEIRYVADDEPLFATLMLDRTVVVPAVPPLSYTVALAWFAVMVPLANVPVIVVELTVCDADTVYVPVPPFPVPSAVIVVPAVTLVPDIVCPTRNLPDVTAVTVSVVVAIEPVTTALLDCPAYSVVEETVCELLMVYVPVPPVPVPSAVMYVPAVTPVPSTVCPTASVPEATALTVSVVVAMDAVITTASWYVANAVPVPPVEVPSAITCNPGARPVADSIWPVANVPVSAVTLTVRFDTVAVRLPATTPGRTNPAAFTVSGTSQTPISKNDFAKPDDPMDCSAPDAPDR